MDRGRDDRRAVRARRHLGRRQFLAGVAGGSLAALTTVPGIGRGARTGLRLGASPAAADGGSTFTALISYGPDDLDPHSSYGTYGPLVSFGMYETLVRYRGGSTNEIEPGLAESWEVAGDQSRYTFHLAPNVLFHDGTPCDAAAVKFSFTRVLGLGLGPVNNIGRFVSDPDQIEVVDPVTVRFNLGRPQPLFLAAMASGYGPYVVSPAAVEEHKTDEDPWAHDWFLASGVGSGPYRLTEYSFNEQIVLSRFEEYYRGWHDNQFDEIVLRVVPENATRRQLIEQHEADALTNSLMPEEFEELKGDESLQVVGFDTTRVNWTVMNAVKLSLEARRGFSYAFPYDDVVDGVHQGLLKRSGPLPDMMRGFDPNVFRYPTDLSKARELILAGGFAEGDRFEYVVEASSVVERTIAQLFQANLQAMGFDLEVVAVDGTTIMETVFGDAPAEERPHFISWSWWPDYNDPWIHLAPSFLAANIGRGGGNSGAWVNARFEELMAEAKNYTDEARLVELMKEAQNILTAQDPPVIYHGQVTYVSILGKEIQGFVPNPLYLEAYPFYQMARTG